THKGYGTRSSASGSRLRGGRGRAPEGGGGGGDGDGDTDSGPASGSRAPPRLLQTLRRRAAGRAVISAADRAGPADDRPASRARALEPAAAAGSRARRRVPGRAEYFAKYQGAQGGRGPAGFRPATPTGLLLRFSEGVSSVEDLLARRRQAERAEAGEHREAERGSAPGQNNLDRASGRSKTPPPAEPGPVSSPSGVKALRHILDLDKIRSSGISGDDIGNMWTAYHATKPNVLSAVIPVKVYEVLMARAKEFPMRYQGSAAFAASKRGFLLRLPPPNFFQFILPVPGRSASEYELYVLQWSFASCYLTSLAEVKAAGAEAARPHLTLTHHGELAKEKGIVLMRGEITEGGGGSGAGLVSAANAHLLAMLVQRFYGGVTGGPRARALLETFHRCPAEFSVDELVADASSLCQK
ncbi:MAG: ATP11 protein-domain-containing protein, partial [Olpidium bornovanus]